jgi:hypothetical protein
MSCNICNETVSLKSFCLVSQSEQVFIFWNQDNWYVFQFPSNIFCIKALHFENVHRKFTCRHVAHFVIDLVTESLSFSTSFTSWPSTYYDTISRI